MGEHLILATDVEFAPHDTMAEWLGKVIGMAATQGANCVEFDIAGKDGLTGQTVVLEFRMIIRRPAEEKQDG